MRAVLDRMNMLSGRNCADLCSLAGHCISVNPAVQGNTYAFAEGENLWA